MRLSKTPPDYHGVGLVRVRRLHLSMYGFSLESVYVQSVNSGRLSIWWTLHDVQVIGKPPPPVIDVYNMKRGRAFSRERGPRDENRRRKGGGVFRRVIQVQKRKEAVSDEALCDME